MQHAHHTHLNADAHSARGCVCVYRRVVLCVCVCVCVCVIARSVARAQTSFSRMMHSLPPPKNALPCSGITSTFLVSNMSDPGCPCTWSQAGAPGPGPDGSPPADPVPFDLHTAESDDAIRGNLEAWGIIITPGLWESFVRPRLRRLQQEWPDAGTVSPRRSELTAAQHTALLFLHMKDVARLRAGNILPGPCPGARDW
jgi:hypothetical protein